MKKLFAIIMAIFVMSFCANVSLACDCPCCEKAKTTTECCKNSGAECECGCLKTECKKVKKCMKKCMKKCIRKCAKKQGCCKKSDIDCSVKCNKEMNPENKKSVSEIITDSVTPENADDTNITSAKCNKSQCFNKCPCMQKCLKKCKKDLSKCPKKGCPLKDIVEE